MSHIQERLFAMSRIPQTNYQTRTTPSAAGSKSHRKVIVTDKNLADYNPETANDKGYSHGVDFPTEQWLLSHDVSIQKTIEASSEEIGRWLLLAFGGLVTSQPDAGGNPTVYLHTFTPQDAATSRQLPATSWIERVASDHNVEYPSCVVEKMSIKGDAKGRITAEATLRGSGKRTVPSGVEFSGGTVHVSVPSAQKYFFNSQVGLVAGAKTYSCKYNSFMFDIENGLLADEGYRPGCALFQTSGDTASGMIRGECLFGERSYPSEFVVRLDSGGEEYAALQAQSDITVVVTITGPVISGIYNHKLVLTLHLSRYKTVKIGESNGIVTLSIQTEPLWDVANSRIVKAELYNTVSSYTT